MEEEYFFQINSSKYKRKMYSVLNLILIVWFLIQYLWPSQTPDNCLFNYFQ